MRYWQQLRVIWRGLLTRKRLTTIEGVVVIVAGIASLLFFVLERSDARDQARRETALQFVALSYGEDVRAAKQASNSFILAHAGDFSKNRELLAAGQKGEFTVPSEAADQFLLRLEFYDQVLICRKLNQCDHRMIDDIFRKDMCSFKDWLAAILPQLEASFGGGIARRLNDYCATG